MDIKKLNDYSYEVEKSGKMLVPLKVFASEKLMAAMKNDACLKQGMNVAQLPGIIGKSLMMPDAHQGYGFSIGGVAAFDAKEGIISPGGIGFDINCGVRLIATSITKDEIMPKIKEILDAVYAAIPSGMGEESRTRLTDDEMDAILKDGAKHLLKQGIGSKDDIEFCEENGCMPGAMPEFVPRRAKSRGRKQLGTLGAGNHFLEIQTVDEVMDEDTAKTFGITKKDQIVIMIHCGSRGLGHQVASEYLRMMEDEFPEIMEKLPEKDLIYAPISSELGKKYFGAMCAAANYAWANRHMIAHNMKKTLSNFFPDASYKAVYDVAHNIAKYETHNVNGKPQDLIVHRKGATRAFGPGSDDIPKEYKSVGQPVLIPGSMGTSSYLLVGTNEGMAETFGSTAHGAGRLMSRHAAKNTFDGNKVQQELESQDIFLKTRSVKSVGDEAPGAYKDVDEVVKVSHEAKIGNLVVKLKPIAVIKG